ncbi:MAG TPA: DUF4097 family beta strand repeat-containing protein [Bryobacteraceae bacterium]|nr:DUF4097 family beta strand repeat-containing protein [Bryobacteraceae bacterium]
MNKILVLALCLAPAALPQEKTLSCDEGGSHWRDHDRYCEMREAVVPAGGMLEVDGGTNGGIAIKAANRSDILVRSRVEAQAEEGTGSRQIVSAIRVETAGGRVYANGPAGDDRQSWSVSYEVFVPAKTDLVLKTHNGGISINGVEGHIKFQAVNGGVSLRRLAGSVEGHTTNGGLHLELADDHWQGDQCDVSTTNGGVTIRVPSNYSAHLETGTVNGGVKIDFPVTVQGEINRQIAVDLGAGGRLVRATTTNGGVRVERM